MKKPLTHWWIYWIALIFICFILAGVLGKAQLVEVAQVTTDLLLTDADNVKKATPSKDCTDGFKLSANLAPSNHFSFYPKQNSPNWEKTPVGKQTVGTSGFFTSGTVLILFFVLYQNSRTDSEPDPFKYFSDNKIVLS